jgi:outer membrane lipoprotein SlyB
MMVQSVRKSSALLVAAGMMAVPFLGGCARDIAGDSYSETHVGEASVTYQGVVQSVRSVAVTGGDHLSDNTMGMALGALAGGLAGSTMGGGKGNLAMTGLGAVAGATAGTMAEKQLKKQQGMEYVVLLNNGSVMTVVQGPKDPCAVGQKVFVIVGKAGRSRVVPRMD